MEGRELSPVLVFLAVLWTLLCVVGASLVFHLHSSSRREGGGNARGRANGRNFSGQNAAERSPSGRCVRGGSEGSEERRSPRVVTVSVNDFLVSQTTEGLWELDYSVARVLRTFEGEVEKLIVIATVANEAEERRVNELLDEAKILVENGKRHRRLFCHTVNGRMSIMRQIEPAMHLESDVQLRENMKKARLHQAFFARDVQDATRCFRILSGKVLDETKLKGCE